jgi:hypothetical protein
MEKYKINKNRPGMTEEEIRQDMDFRNLMNSRKPGLKIKGWKVYGLGLVAAALVITPLLVVLLTPAKTTTHRVEETTQDSISQKAIDRPLKGVDVLYTVYLIEAGKDTVLVFPSGTHIRIPANAFLDQGAQPVKGTVEIHYRELHDLADVFVSGIDMVYDSLKSPFQFQSAGMIDFRPFQNGKALAVNPKNLITLQFVSDVKDGHYNVYYLDTVQKRWEYVKNDEVRKLPVDSTNEYFTREGGSDLPLEPVKAKAKLQCFNVQFDRKEFPDFGDFEGIRFQVSEMEKNYNPALSKKEWEHLELKKTEKWNEYQITFSNSSPQESHTFKVIPVFAGKDYEKAKKEYDRRVVEWQKASMGPRVVKPGKIDSIYWKQYTRMKDANDFARGNMRYESGGQQTENLVSREFQLSRFGIWNSDCPKSLPKGKMIFAKFKDEQGKNFNFNHVYLVEKGKKLMYNYYPGQYATFTYNPLAENFIWAVTKENKLAVFKATEFSKIKNDKDTTVFKMTVLNAPVHSASDVRILLGI